MSYATNSVGLMTGGMNSRVFVGKKKGRTHRLSPAGV